MRIIITTIALLSLCAVAYAFDPMPDVQSEVFHVEGTATDLAKRGELCIARLVRNDGITVADGTSATTEIGGLLDNPMRHNGKVQQLAGGSVIVASSPESGLVVANNRLPYKLWGLGGLIQSTLTFEAKDGRSRITHSKIQEATKYTGSLANQGFTQVNAKTPMEKKAAEELQKESAAIAECVRKPAGDW